MLIIFDLDDTLIQTSHCITPYMLKEVVFGLVKKGLKVEDVELSIQKLQEIDRQSENGRQSLLSFFELMGYDQKYYTAAVDILYNLPPLDLPIVPLENALELLEFLKKEHDLALVTIGNRELQFKKMKNAGIDSRLFSKIAVSEINEKKSHYQEIIEQLRFFPSSTLVCGDKISTDLVPAKELGATTVHMRHGRGVNAQGDRSKIDFSIEKLDEIRQIIISLNDRMVLKK